MRTLYISDLDGTLLGADSRISAESSAIIDDACGRGALFTVATARTPATVVPILERTATSMPPVVMTGCARWLRADGRFDHASFMPADELDNILDLCAARGVHPFVYVMAPDGRSLDVYHAAKGLNRAEEKFWSERNNLVLKRFHLGTPAPERARSAGMLLFAMGRAEDIVLAADEFRQHTACTVYAYPDIFDPSVFNLEVFPPGVDKARAVEALKKDAGADRLVVFGDSVNDLSMLAVADVAVAMENALPAVKAAADIVIGPNTEPSVARFIIKDFEENACK